MTCMHTANFIDTAQYYKQQHDSKASGLSALQWDTAELKEVGVTSEMNYDDAFTIEKVDHSYKCSLSLHHSRLLMS